MLRRGQRASRSARPRRAWPSNQGGRAGASPTKASSRGSNHASQARGRDRPTSRADPPSRPEVLRRGRAGDLRPRVRPARRAAQGARSRASRVDHARQPHAAGRRSAGRGAPAGRASRADALDRQHLQPRRVAAIRRASGQAPARRADRVGRRAEDRRRGRLAASTKTACSCAASPAATAAWATTSPTTSAPCVDVPLRLSRPRRPAGARGPRRNLHDQLRPGPAQRVAAAARAMPPFANTRNVTAGSIRLLDPRICARAPAAALLPRRRLRRGAAGRHAHGVPRRASRLRLAAHAARSSVSTRSPRRSSTASS